MSGIHAGYMHRRRAAGRRWRDAVRGSKGILAKSAVRAWASASRLLTADPGADRAAAVLGLRGRARERRRSCIRTRLSGRRWSSRRSPASVCYYVGALLGLPGADDDRRQHRAGADVQLPGDSSCCSPSVQTRDSGRRAIALFAATAADLRRHLPVRRRAGRARRELNANAARVRQSGDPQCAITYAVYFMIGERYTREIGSAPASRCSR